MKLEDLAFLMGKSREDVESMLKSKDVIELNLTEHK